MFATIQRFQSLTLSIHGTVAEPYPNAIGAQVRVSCGGNSARAGDCRGSVVRTDARALAVPLRRMHQRIQTMRRICGAWAGRRMASFCSRSAALGAPTWSGKRSARKAFQVRGAATSMPLYAGACCLCASLCVSVYGDLQARCVIEMPPMASDTPETRRVRTARCYGTPDPIF